MWYTKLQSFYLKGGLKGYLYDIVMLSSRGESGKMKLRESHEIGKETTQLTRGRLRGSHKTRTKGLFSWQQGSQKLLLLCSIIRN